MIAVTLEKKWDIIVRLELALIKVRALEDLLWDCSRVLELRKAKTQDLIITDFINFKVQDSLTLTKEIREALHEIKSKAINLGYNEDLHLRIVTDYS